MKTIKLLPSALLPLVLAATAHAAPLVSVGDQVDVFFKGQVEGRYDRNVTNSSRKHADTSVDMAPGVEALIGRNSAATGRLFFREDFLRFNRFDQLNEDLSNVFADGSIDFGRGKISADASFQELYQNTADLSGTLANAGNAIEIVRRDQQNAGTLVSYNVSPIFDAEIGARYMREDYVGRSPNTGQSYGTIFNGLRTYTIPASIYYKYSPKLDIGGTYRWRYSDVSAPYGAGAASAASGRDRMDNFGGVSVRGELFPKVTGKINVGFENHYVYAYRPAPGVGAGSEDYNSLAFDGNVTWAATEKLSVTVGGSRDFATGASGQNIETTGGNVLLTYQITEVISANGSIAYNRSDYKGTRRADDLYTLGTGLEWKPNSYLTFGVGYVYSDNASNSDNGANGSTPGIWNSYMDQEVKVTASLRY